MKNTHTEYLSSERTPTVYPELEELLPALSEEEFSALEVDILTNGCYAPITVNQDLVIVDGYCYCYRRPPLSVNSSKAVDLAVKAILKCTSCHIDNQILNTHHDTH